MRIIKSVLIILFVTASLISCKKDSKNNLPNSTENSVIQEITIDELKALKTDVQLVDVRTPNEFEDGYIKNAININVKSSDFIENTVLLDKTKPVYLYCLSGVRSAKAAKIMKKSGFTKIYNYSGGFSEWVEEGNTISMD